MPSRTESGTVCPPEVPIRGPRFRRPKDWIRWLAFLAAILIGTGLNPASAQERPFQPDVTPTDQLVELTLTDGSVLVGRIVEAGDPFHFTLVSGVEMTIAVANVTKANTAVGVVEEGEFWPADPNQTRLFFGPTARTVKAGQGYLAVYEVIMPFVGVGITDSFLMAAGTPLFFGDGASHPFWIAPKLKFYDSGKTQAAVGLLAVSWEDEDFGLLYGLLSRGNEKNSVTLGIAYGYTDGELGDTPAFMVGAEGRSTRGIKIITENYIFPGEGALLSLGPRFFGRKLSADLGLAVAIGDGLIVAFPVINFVYNF